MIRIRHKNGKVSTAPADALAVEICDTEGRPAVVLVNLPDGRIRQLEAGSPEFEHYCKLYRTGEASRIINIPATR